MTRQMEHQRKWLEETPRLTVFADLEKETRRFEPDEVRVRASASSHSHSHRIMNKSLQLPLPCDVETGRVEKKKAEKAGDGVRACTRKKQHISHPGDRCSEDRQGDDFASRRKRSARATGEAQIERSSSCAIALCEEYATQDGR